MTRILCPWARCSLQASNTITYQTNLSFLLVSYHSTCSVRPAHLLNREHSLLSRHLQSCACGAGQISLQGSTDTIRDYMMIECFNPSWSTLYIVPALECIADKTSREEIVNYWHQCHQICTGPECLSLIHLLWSTTFHSDLGSLGAYLLMYFQYLLRVLSEWSNSYWQFHFAFAHVLSHVASLFERSVITYFMCCTS